MPTPIVLPSYFLIIEVIIEMFKKQLRTDILAQRAALPAEYFDEANPLITHYLLSLPEYHTSSSIFCFNSMPREFDTDPFMKQATADGKSLYLPRVVSMKEGQMRLLVYQPGDPLEKAKFGALEPYSSQLEVCPEAVDLVILPCVTANYRGERMGYGGGFYDRFLEKTSAVPVLVCFDALMSEEIPLDPHDHLAPIVVSEKGIFRP